MSFSVGILYSSHNFLRLVRDSEINSIDFPNMFKKFYVVADAKAVLETSLECKWVTLKEDNRLKLTKRGELILTYPEVHQRLRIQLAHLIETYRPSWAPLIIFGRAEALRYFSAEVKQCFSEAYLLEGYEYDVIEWWDKLATATKGYSEDIRLELGRKGEKLSIEFEKARTGLMPTWQAIDSNFSGYDILSQINSENPTPLRIEVKATNSRKEISFIITKGEWDVAINSENYVFHIWSLVEPQALFIFPKKDMQEHIPKNNGKGKWDCVEITLTQEEMKSFKVL